MSLEIGVKLFFAISIFIFASYHITKFITRNHPDLKDNNKK
jgi:flagellar biogenesis protein FliO